MRLEAFLGKEEARLAHALAAFRCRYEGMNPGERRQTNDWVLRLADLEANTPRGLREDQRVCVEVMEDTPQGGLQVYRVPVSILRKAIAAWQQNEFYTLSLDDLLGDGIQLQEGY